MLQFLLAASLILPSGQPIAWEIRSARVPATVDANELFEAAALSWAGVEEAVRVRTSVDGVLWSEWIPATIDEDLTDRAERRYFTSILHFGEAQRYLEYSLPASAAGPREIVVTFFAPPAAPSPPERSITEALAVGALPIRSRLEWGCPDGEESRWTPAYTTVSHAVVHHTAGASSVPDWDAEMRNIWYFHTVTRGWGDIGYNYLIDPNGVIYEGRAGGLGAIGAHFSCRNTNTAGISLLGTFTNALPTPAALDMLKRLLAELTRAHGIKPDTFVYHAPTALNLPTIPGHRDANPSSQTCSTTECPGESLYAYLPILRSDVATCPPVITTPPASTSIAAGDSAALSVTATSSEPLAYQWYVGITSITETPLEAATSATLTVTPTTTTSYWVRVSTGCGTADSEIAVVVVGASRRRGARPGE